MAIATQSPTKHTPHKRAGRGDEFGRLTVFQRMRQQRKQGQNFVPSPIMLADEQPPSATGIIPTYEDVFAFSRRTGLSPATIDQLLEKGFITCLRLENDGAYVNVRKALAEIEGLERKCAAV